MSTPVVIDTDPGIDDALAIMLALASPELEVLALTSVGGNVGVELTTRNALDLLALCGRGDIPVGAGAARALLRTPPRNAEHVHGGNGLGGVDLPRAAARPDPRGALGLLRDTISGSARPVTVIALGPLTNLAVLHAAHPDLFARIDRIVLMGGGVRRPLGNVTPTAEFNIWFDPEAASRVFSAGVPITMIGLDVTAVATLEPGDWAGLQGGGPIARAALRMVDYYGDFYLSANGTPATAQHDSLAVAAACRPDLVRCESLLVDVECDGTFTRGMTVAHFHATDLAGGRVPNVSVALDVDVARFTDLLVSRIAGLDAGAARPSEED